MHGRRNIISLTTNTTLTFPGHNGVLLTNEGVSGEITITIPAGSTALRGCWFEVYAATANSVIIATTTTDTLALYNDVGADSLAWSSVGEIVGNSARFVCLGAGTAGSVAGWICQLMPAVTTVTAATQTIATS